MAGQNHSNWRAVMIILLFLIFIKDSKANDDCESPQFLETGKTGLIRCAFKDFYGLVWYNPGRKAVIRMENSLKSGWGLLSNEFNVLGNGSLVITNVTIQHNGTFTVALLETRKSEPISQDVNIFVVAKYFKAVPFISNCNETDDICFMMMTTETEVLCIIHDAPFVVPLTLVARTINGDHNVSDAFEVTNNNSSFTTLISLSNSFTFPSLLTLLVCKGQNSNGLLRRNESFLIIQKDNKTPSLNEPVKKYVEISSKLEVSCTSDNRMLYLVWQRKKSQKSVPRNVALAVFNEGIFQLKDKEFELRSDGTLIIDEIGTQHEGLYQCISGDGLDVAVILYDVVVIIPASPPYPVVEWCDVKRYCVLEMQSEGSLMCTMRAIRPPVELEFELFYKKYSKAVHLYDVQMVIKENGNAFDVILSSKFRVIDDSTRLTMACQVAGSNIKQFSVSTKFDLLITIPEMNTPNSSEGNDVVTNDSQILWIIFVVPIIVTVVIGCMVFYVVHGCEQRPIDRHRRIEEDIPMIAISGQQEKKKTFIAQLKAKYEDLYNAVQPIPYVRERLLSIDKVFVQGGIQFLVEKKNIAGPGTWEVLDSHHSIFSDPRVQSSRFILEGDPGYGKTTLTLQFAYDWCKEARPSYIEDTDIFILLRLRQLEGITSIYKAIKLFLLPKDSNLTEKNIEDILSNSSSLLLMLDGYDEFPDRNVKKECDISSIINRNMFQKSISILTTRTSCLPMRYSPLTKRLKLTGFDDEARDQYIMGAVVGNDVTAATELKQRLRKNPLLRDICQIPLFFVMFAHITHESHVCLKFQTVTELFRHMISCLHSHEENKMKHDKIIMHSQRILLEKEHRQLDLLSYDMLKHRVLQMECRKEDLCERLGMEVYDQYFRIGVLVEDDILKFSATNISYDTQVRFCHKLFCEWYAAHHLSEYASQEDSTIDNDLKSFDPIELQYLYLFACGLNATAAKKIIDYLKGRNDTDNFIIACLLEQSGNIEHVLESLKDSSSRQISIYESHSLLLQRSSIQLLHISSANKIPISSVRLINSFSRVVQSEGICIQLKSIFSIPVLLSLKKLTIEERCREFTAEEMADILRYSSMCLKLEKLVFFGCLVPRFVHSESNTVLKSREVKVCWAGCQLNFDFGQWEYEKGGVMKDVDYLAEVEWCRGSSS